MGESVGKFGVKELIGLDLNMKQVNFVLQYTRDFNASRAAKASGYPNAKELLKDEVIKVAVNRVLEDRLIDSEIDATWVQNELVNNHYLALQSNNIGASNSALSLLAKLNTVDAMATSKVDVNVSGEDIAEILRQGRERAAAEVVDGEIVENKPFNAGGLSFYESK